MANTPIPLAVLQKILTNPGILLVGVLGSSLPSTVPVGGIFNDDWTTVAGWTPLGPTDNGSQFHDVPTFDQIMVAESYYEVANVVTGKAASVDFALAHITAANIKAALNGATLTTTGTGATTLSTITPGVIGSEVRQMIGWESNDHTARLVGYQAINVGGIEPEFRKGATKALLTCNFRFENASPAAWQMFLAGTSRAA